MQLKKAIALFLCLLLCMQVLTGSVFATETTTQSISGNGVKVVFDETTATIALYKVEGENELQMSHASEMGYPIVNGQAVQDFTNHTCTVVTSVNGVPGTDQRMTITSTSPSTGLTRTYTLEVSADVADVIYTQTTYSAGDAAVTPTWFVDNVFRLQTIQAQFGAIMAAAKARCTIMTQSRKLT